MRIGWLDRAMPATSWRALTSWSRAWASAGKAVRVSVAFSAKFR